VTSKKLLTLNQTRGVDLSNEPSCAINCVATEHLADLCDTNTHVYEREHTNSSHTFVLTFQPKILVIHLCCLMILRMF